VISILPEPQVGHAGGILNASTAQGVQFKIKVPRSIPGGAGNEVLVSELAFALGVPNSLPARLVEPISALELPYSEQAVAILQRHPDEFRPIASQEHVIHPNLEAFLTQLAVWALYLAATGTADRHEYNILWNQWNLQLTEIDFEDSFSSIGSLTVQLDSAPGLEGIRNSETHSMATDPRFVALKVGLSKAHALLHQGRSTIVSVLAEARISPKVVEQVLRWIDLDIESKLKLLETAL
jgi:hypothetical protein